MQVVSSAKDLEVVALRHQSLADVVDLLGLLGLTTAHGEDNIAVDVVLDSVTKVALVTNQTGLLGVLQVVSMAFVDFAIHCLLDPDDLIN